AHQAWREAGLGTCRGGAEDSRGRAPRRREGDGRLVSVHVLAVVDVRADRDARLREPRRVGERAERHRRRRKRADHELPARRVAEREDARRDRRGARQRCGDDGDRDDAGSGARHRRHRDLDVGGRSDDVREEPARVGLLRRLAHRPSPARLRHVSARARALRPRSRGDRAAGRGREDDGALGCAARDARSRRCRGRKEGGPYDLRPRGDPGSRRAWKRRAVADRHLVRHRQRRDRARQRQDDVRAARPRAPPRRIAGASRLAGAMIALVAAEGPLLDEILASTFEIWSEGLSRSAYAKYNAAQRTTPWGRAHLRHWALVDGGQMLASAKEYLFDATLDGRAIRACGIGAVFTQPRHRGRGHARALIERLIERAAADGCDLALLFSDIDPGYYARLGFTPIPTCDLALRVVESSRHGAPAVLVRTGEDRDLTDLAAMNEVRASRYRFHLARDR